MDTTNASTFLAILQMSDTGFPTGGFSHSVGLESAEKHGLVHSTNEYKEFLVAVLENTASQQLPFLNEAHICHANLNDVIRLDRHFETAVPNHVANRASQRQGRSFTETCSKTFPQCTITQQCQQQIASGVLIGHLPVMFGVVCADLGVDVTSARLMFLFNTLKNVVAASVRLGRLGPMQAQALQQELQQTVPHIIKRNEDLGIEDVHIKFPIVDIVQNIHDTMFSKLFYS